MPGIVRNGITELFYYKSFNGCGQWRKKDFIMITQTIPPCGQCNLVKDSLYRQDKWGFELEIKQDGVTDELVELAKEYGFSDQLGYASFPIVLFFDGLEYLGVRIGLRGIKDFEREK